MSFPLTMLQGRWSGRCCFWGMIFALLIFKPCCGAGEPALHSNYFLRSWNADKGLPDNSVMSVLQTRDGFLWMATYGGLARFDGIRFVVFNSANTPGLQTDRFSSLFEDAEGNLWIGHEHGELSRYHDGKFETFTTHENGTRRKINAINQDKTGAIWMLNEEGTLVRVRDGKTCALPNSNGGATMTRDTDGKLWVVSDGKLACLQDAQLCRLSGTNGFTDDYVQGICASGDGGLWVATDDNIRKWRAGRWPDSLGTNPCTSMLTAMTELKSGGLAIGAVGSGLFILTPGKPPLHFGHNENFPHDWIRCLCEDREGTLWGGAGNAGIVALRAGPVETFLPPDRWQGHGGAQSVAAAHDGAIWVSTEGAGIYRFFNDAWTHYDESSGLLNMFVWCVAEDSHHRIWAGTWGGGMFVLKNGRFVKPPGLESITVPMPAILHGSNDVVWIGTTAGLLRYHDGAVKWFGEREGLKQPDVRAIAEAPDGTVWFGMVGGGLGRLQDGMVKQFTKADGLPNDYIQSLYLDPGGTLWIGSFGGGICRLRDGHFAQITAAEGLPNSFISAIEGDGLGNFWISTRGGLFCVPQKSLEDCADGKISKISFRSFGLGEGMPTVICSGGLQPAVARGLDGRLWFPTPRGLVAVNPAATFTAHWPVPVRLEEVSVNDHPVLPANDGAAPVKIAPGEQGFKFRYTGLSFIAPESIQFQRRLDGWEKDWVDAGNQRVAEYSYLPSGDYCFHVRASYNDGTWNTEGATFAFTVLPHFWQTWWFDLLSTVTGIALVAVVVWQISRRRMHRKLADAQRQQAIERERTRIAKDIHDHLGANLTRISLLSQSAHGELENPAQAAAQLDRIYDTSRELTRSMDEIVWAVNPQHDTLDSLANYLGNFAQDYLVPLRIRCRLEVPLQLPHWHITAELRHNIFLAFKEALHNVVKHAGATEVLVELATGADKFTLVVRDNGRGFDPATVQPRPGRGNGLKNLVQRLKKNGGECRIFSAPGNGTEIRFVMPMKSVS